MEATEQCKLGASGLTVPALGIGTDAWGEKLLGYGKSHSKDDLRQAYSYCLDQGLNFFDTAPGYGRGESERILGEFRRKDGRPIVIATKFAPPGVFSPSFNFSPRNLLVSLDGSLKRLGVECIDLFMLHFPPSARKLDSYMDVLAEAVRAGKVKAVGVSNFNASLLRAAHSCLTSHGIPLASNEVGYNLLRRYPERNGVINACRELNVALIAYTPLASGILTGKYRALVTRYPGTFSWYFRFTELDPYKETGSSGLHWMGLFSKPRVLRREKLEPLFKVLEEIAKIHEKTIAQVAVRWLMRTDKSIIPIPGAKNLKQASENAGVVGWHLTTEEYARIDQAELIAR